MRKCLFLVHTDDGIQLLCMHALQQHLLFIDSEIMGIDTLPVQVSQLLAVECDAVRLYGIVGQQYFNLGEATLV